MRNRGPTCRPFSKRFSRNSLAEPELEEAERQQRLLAERVCQEDRFDEIRLVAGVDVHYLDAERARAVAALLRLPELELCEVAEVNVHVTFPYVPGLFSFREAPAVLAALQELSQAPHLILCDGHGRAHPRRFGLACHVGVVADCPTVGVAKSWLVGTYPAPPAEKGRWVPLVDGGEVVGAVVRTRANVRPVFVSVGHKVSLTSAVYLVLRCVGRYRLPEPLRWAHRLATDPDDAVQEATLAF